MCVASRIAVVSVNALLGHDKKRTVISHLPTAASTSKESFLWIDFIIEKIKCCVRLRCTTNIYDGLSDDQQPISYGIGRESGNAIGIR